MLCGKCGERHGLSPPIHARVEALLFLGGRRSPIPRELWWRARLVDGVLTTEVASRKGRERARSPRGRGGGGGESSCPLKLRGAQHARGRLHEPRQLIEEDGFEREGVSPTKRLSGVVRFVASGRITHLERNGLGERAVVVTHQMCRHRVEYPATEEEELIAPTMGVRRRLSLRKRREIGERSEEQTLVVKLRRKKESG